MGILKANNFKTSYSKLKIGMSKSEVIDMLGQPNSVKHRENMEVLTWWSREWKGYLRGGSVERRITVEFIDNAVCGYDGENVDASIL